MASLATATAPAGAAQYGPWITYPAGQATANGSAPNIVLVGDSLIVNADRQTVANQVRNVAGGRKTLVEASYGASWMTFGWPGLQNNNGLVWDLANWMNSRLTIVALASNDARILTQAPAHYNAQMQFDVMHNAVQLTRQHSACVLLVNVEPRTVPEMTAANATTVNANMLWLVNSYAGGGVYLADWAAHAQPSWFQSGSLHLTSTGTTNYRNFIQAAVNHVVQVNGC